LGRYATRPGNVDVLFVDVPRDFSSPESSWCLGYRYLISSVRTAGFSAGLLHPPLGRGRSSRQRLIEEIVRSDARIVGMTTYDVQLRSLLQLVRELRQAGLRSHVVLGGLCASAIPERLLLEHPGVDSVVFGEGETPIVDLARYVIRREGTLPAPGLCVREGDAIRKGDARGLAPDLDDLPAPALDDFRDPEESSPLRLVNGCVPVVASRGCYGRCSFCCIHPFYRARPGKVWRGRSPAGIVDEIEALHSAVGAERVTFVDENFMGPGAIGRRHALGIADEIRRRGLKVRFNFGCRPNDVDRETIVALRDAGLAAVSLGIESMSPDTLELFKKGTTPRINRDSIELMDELGIPVEITFIFFHPLSRLSDIRENLEFVEFVRQRPHAYFSSNHPFTEFVPFFGTELSGLLEGRGLVRRSLDGWSVDYADPRVAFIVECVRRVPVDALSRLRRVLPADRSETMRGLAAGLRDWESHLNMVQLPELISDLCGLLEQGAPVDGSRVRAAARAFDRDADGIRSLAGQILAHVP
jgi:anaerobic magnesium-protoporphyrin IX monomethyl ester cyclase